MSKPGARHLLDANRFANVVPILSIRIGGWRLVRTASIHRENVARELDHVLFGSFQPVNGRPGDQSMHRMKSPVESPRRASVVLIIWNHYERTSGTDCDFPVNATLGTPLAASLLSMAASRELVVGPRPLSFPINESISMRKLMNTMLAGAMLAGLTFGMVGCTEETGTKEEVKIKTPTGTTTENT